MSRPQKTPGMSIQHGEWMDRRAAEIAARKAKVATSDPTPQQEHEQ